MSQLLFFIIGGLLGSISGVVCMCLLQVNRLSEKEDEHYAEKKRSDTFSS